ncbi:uncharacterized protein LOC132395068 isoform X2 [Hypanus sabinus]|uniref:uncharacterized protein LOC132395068 isoform X2 n=1 Tax=Hypanus sabinus TaxID=79690 RepID=UPI0028C3D59B|nr:uncharacterized protein LOC132395068 isoform X2 [Hypanus sabinus]
MLQSFMLRVLCLLSVSLLAICMAGSGAAPLTVTGTLGQSASLPPGIPDEMDVAEFVWKRNVSAVVLYVKGNITYFGSEDFRSRLTLDLVSFSLQIRNLRREDAGDYEALVTSGSGAEHRVTMRLEVYESSGLTMIQIIIISSVSGIFVIVLLICLTCFINKNVKHRQKPQITGEPPPVETEYAAVQAVRSRAAGQQTRQGNEMVHGHNDWLEVPNTVYATVNSPGNPAAEPARGKRGARRNVRDSSFEMYETVNYPGIPRMATIRNGAGARGKSSPI